MSPLPKIGSIALLVLFCGFFFGAYATPTAPTLNLSIGASSFSLTGAFGPVDSGLTIVDPTSGTITAANVRISSGFENGDVLSLPNGAAYSGITGTYDAGKGILSLSGSGTAAQYQAALRAVVFSTTNSATTRRSMDFTLGSAIAYNGHLYEIVNSPEPWPVARAAATNRILFGVAGYLANITSPEENNFIQLAFGQDAWMGASDADTEGVWKWMDGPEAGTTFWNGGPGGSAPADEYANWGVGQPSNDGNIENYGAFNGSSGGKWNDYGGSGPYIVEYGDSSASISFSGTKQLIASSALSSIDGTSVLLDFQVPYTAAILSEADGWSTSDPVNRPDGYASDEDPYKTNNILGLIGGNYSVPSKSDTQLTYNFNPGNSDRYTFQWTQNIRSSVDNPGDDIFGWKFASGGNTAFEIQFLNDRGPDNDRDLLVQGYDSAGNALTLASGQPNKWFIDRDDANDFRLVADLSNKRWFLDVFNKSNNTWFGLVTNAVISSSINSLNAVAATWAVTSTNGPAGAGDNFMSFDNITIQGKQTVVIDLNLPASNPTYNGLPKTITPTTTPSGVSVVVKYDGSTNQPVNAGTYTVTAEVVDTTTYYSAPTSGILQVVPAEPLVSWSTPSAITYGAGLSTNQLNASANVIGTFTYTPLNGSVLSAGTNTLTAVFTPNDTNNYVPRTNTVSLVVNKANPVITWSNPPAITYGTALSTNELNATADVAGNFSYNPTNGTVLNSGTNILTVIFTASDSSNYVSPLTNTVNLLVNKALQTLSFPGLANGTVGGSVTLTATSSSGLPVTYTSSDTSVATVIGSTLNYVGVGLVTITASQAGNSNYEAAVDAVRSVTVNSNSPYDTWIASYGYTVGAAPALRTADPDGDGVNNLTEFAFGLDPTANTPSPITISRSNAIVTLQWLQRNDGTATYTNRSTTNLTTGFPAGSSVNFVGANSTNTNNLPRPQYVRREFSTNTTGFLRHFYKVDAREVQ